MDWIDVVHDRDQWRALVNTIMHLWVPQNAGKFLSSCTTGGFTSRSQLLEVSYLYAKKKGNYFSIMNTPTFNRFLDKTCLKVNVYGNYMAAPLRKNLGGTHDNITPETILNYQHKTKTRSSRFKVFAWV
jgi:hypothetical protein